MKAARDKSTAGARTPAVANNTRRQPRGLLTRSRGGNAIGARIVGGYRARQPQRCLCCRCRIRRGGLVYEVVTADGRVLEVCVDCVGGP
jgi:hypothetical protein